MAEDWQVEKARQLILWPYEDLEPIRHALTAGDTESEDREGHRRLAQYGDNLIPFIIATIGVQMGVSRQSQSVTQVLIQKKKDCARRARMCHLDKLVKISPRQCHDGPQPTTLKNAMFALVAAVYLQAGDWSQTVMAMENLGLLCRKESIQPYELSIPIASTDLLAVLSPYRPQTAEETGNSRLAHSTDNSGDPAGEDTHRIERTASLLELDSPLPGNGPASIVATVPDVQSYLSTSQASSTGMHDSKIQPILTSKNDSVDYMSWTHQLEITSKCFVDDVVDSETSGTRIDISSGSKDEPPAKHSEQASKDGISSGTDSETNNQDLDFQYLDPILALPTRHQSALIRSIQCIGSSAALLSLRLVIANFRELEAGRMGKESAWRIAHPRPSVERLAAIDDLSACMAHFTLVQRMHIYMLYKDASVDIASTSDTFQGHGAFVLESGMSALRPRGNPRNRHAAAISRNIIAPGRSMARVKRMRRLGHRLNMLVEKFGRGVLALLDEKLTHEMLLKVTDRVFTDFVALVHEYEGDRICFISERANLIVDMLFHDGENVNAPKLRIEDVEDDGSILEKPRCSLALAEMLLPQDPVHHNACTQDH